MLKGRVWMYIDTYGREIERQREGREGKGDIYRLEDTNRWVWIDHKIQINRHEERKSIDGQRREGIDRK